MRVILQEMMAKRGWNQRELSQRSGVPQPMISEIISSTVKDPRISTLCRLARGLRCTVDDLIQDEEEKQ